MKDEVIRIILEAKDRLSRTVKDAERNVNQSFGNIRNDLARTDKDFENFQNDFTRNLNKSDNAMKRWSTSMRNRFRGIRQEVSETRKELDKAIGSKVNIGGPSGDPRFPSRFTSAAADREAQREANKPVRSPAAVAISTAFGAFQQGRQQASELEKQIRAQVATTKENLDKQKKALEERIHLERESIIEDGNIRREQLRREIVERSKSVGAEILTERQAQADRQAERDKDLENEIRTRKGAFEDLRKKAEDALREEVYERKQLFYDEQYARKQQLKDDIAGVRSSSQFSKAEKDREIDALRKAEADINRQEQRRRDDDIRQLEIADDKIKRKDATDRDIDIAKQTASAAEIRRLDARETDDKVRKLQAGNSEINKEAEVALASELRQRRQAAETEFRALRQGLRTGANEADIVKEFLEARKAEQALSGDTNRLSNTFRSAGNAFGDFTRGLRRGRSDLREVDKLARSADTGFARFGQTVGRFTKNIGNLVNLRWYLIISAVQVLGQLVLVLAANLISLASSAAIAASALGAGLLAAVSQAIPVVGLLYAAFNRVTAAFTAAQQASKANATSSQDSRAQAEAQTAAQQSLSDALYSQVQAVKALAEARKQAGRDIVDSINAEIDANYALKDAEFAVLDAKEQLRQLEQQSKQDNQDVKDAQAQVKEAKERLAAAQKEGDNAEIEKAQQQLAIAKQNLSDAQGQATTKDNKRQIAEQKLAVKEAQQRQKEAKIAQQRQREDTTRTVKLGVKGNQQVVDALHGVATANREVANAQRGVTDAMTKQASAGNLLNQQLSQLDPAERGLYKAFRRIQKTFKDNFRPITDIIVNAVTGAVGRFNKALQNPEILHGFRALAKVIGKGITELSKFFTSKGFLHDFAGFIHAAIGNVPTLIKIIEHLIRAFLGLAKAGQPIVKDLLGRFAGVTGRLSRAINSPVPLPGGPAGESPQRAATAPRETRGQRFIANAKTYLDSWIKLADAIGRVFKYLFIDAAPSGDSLVKSLTRALNNLADFLKDNPQKVKKFFDGMKDSLIALSQVLFPLVKVLLSAFTGNNATQFTKFTVQVVLPGIAAMIQFLGLLAKVAIFLSNLPGLGPIIKIVLQFLVFEKTLNKIFPATQKITDAVKASIGWFFKAGEDGSKGFTKIWRAMQFAAFRIKYYAVLARDQILKIANSRVVNAITTPFKRIITYLNTTFVPAVKRTAIKFGEYMKAMALATVNASKRAILWLGNLVKEMIIAVVNAAKTMAKAIYEAAVAALEAMSAFIIETLIPALTAMGVAMYASLGPWGLVIAAVVAIIAVIVLLIRHFHLLKPAIKAIGDAFKFLFNWIKDNWKKILGWLTYPFTEAYKGIKWFFDKIKGFFLDVISWIKDHWKLLVEILIAAFIPGGLIILAFYKFKDKILGVFKDIWNGIKKIFHDIAHFLTSELTPHIHIHHFLGIPYPSITFGDEKDKSTQTKGVDSPAINPKTGPVAPIKTPKGFGPPPPKRRQQFETGGRILGPSGKEVPIIAHAGEWVLNKVQQMKIAKRLNESTEQVSAFLFGTKLKDKKKPGRNTTKTRPGKVHKLPNKAYTLHEQIDNDGNPVWFIELDDGSYAGVTGKDAAKIQATHGNFIPGYIKRDTHGFTQAGQKALRKKSEIMKSHPIFGIRGTFAMGGIVPDTPTFAMGGIVTSPQNTYGVSSVSNKGGDTKHQHNEMNFNVKTEGETDWNYVLRLAAMHASSSF